MTSTDAARDDERQAEDTDAVFELRLLGSVLASHLKRASGDVPSALRAVFEAGGLSNRHGGVLAWLLHADAVTVGEVARQLGLGLTNVSHIVSELDRAGLVRRHSDPSNRRQTLVSLRAHVRPEVEALVARRTAPLERAMQRLSVDQRAAFMAGLRAWVGELDD